MLNEHRVPYTPNQKNQQQQKVVVLNLIQPARQLIGGNLRFNSVYVQNLQSLPHAMQFSDDLYPLAISNSIPDFTKSDYEKKIYQKNMSLRINPFETKNYFKNPAFMMMPYTDPLKINKKYLFRAKEGELLFDSNFQSGNLYKAVKVSIEQHHYHLTMHNDINTYGCTQWFFFKTINKQCNRSTFYINNFYKPKSLYQKGMKILIFSKQKSINQNTGWIRGGQDISYFSNKLSQQRNGNTIKKYHTLKFSYYFEYEEDQVYFAYNYPYTYSKLNHFINEKLQVSYSFMNRKILCKTIAENKVPLLTITNPEINKSQKKCIFLTARVHPGQTVSSLIIQGIIESLLQNTEIAQKLRNSFIFKIVPMLNPDGVIHGNYRTNLAGIDLNRIWQQPDKILSPQIYELKKYIIEFNKQCEVLMFCDIHGHSSKKSVFVYGCNNQIHNRNKMRRRTFKYSKQDPKLFPFMVSNINKDFNFNFCNFQVQKNKSGTARVELWKQLKISNIFTLQASFCSAQHSQYHFRPQDYKKIGISFCNTLYQYFHEPTKKQEMKTQLIKFQQAQKNFRNNQQPNSDSQSQNDLFDANLRNKLAESKCVEIPRRKLIVKQQKQQQSIERQESRKIKKRLTTYSCQKKIKTQMSEYDQQKAFDEAPKKISTFDFPLKKITIESNDFNSKNSKKVIVSDYSNNGLWKPLDRAFLHRIQHSYRGKSSMYRIKRRGPLDSSIQPRRSSVYRLKY